MDHHKQEQAGVGVGAGASASSSSSIKSLTPEYWLQIHEKHRLVILQLREGLLLWLDEDDIVAKNSFDTTVGVIARSYNSIVTIREDVSELLKDDTCMFLLFQLSDALLSLGHMFSTIKFYNNVKSYVNVQVLDSKEFPDAEAKNKIFVKIQSYIKILQTSNCRKTNLLVQMFNDVFNLKIDPEEFSKFKTRDFEMYREKNVVSHLKGIASDAQPEDESSSKKRDIVPESSTSSNKRKLVDDSQMVDIVCGKTTFVADVQPPVLDSAKEMEIISDAEVKLVLEHMKMSKNEDFRSCVLKSLNKLEKNSNDYITNTLFGVKQMLSEIFEHLHLPEVQQVAGGNPPSSKFKWILLILKEMMTQIRESSYADEFGFTIPEYLETKTAEDVKKFGISYESTESFPENLENCDDVELLFRLELSKSMQSMVRLQNLIKDQFLSFQQVVKERGHQGTDLLKDQMLRLDLSLSLVSCKTVDLDVESFDLLRYLVACVKQMKNDLKEKVKQLSLDVQQPRVLYEGPNVRQKMRLFQNEIVKDLSADLEFCRQCCYLCNREMFEAFHMLILELELTELDECKM